jgi:TP901 family phage tail tape measure protein
MDSAGGAVLGFVAVGARLVATAASITSAIGVASVKAFADFDAAMTKSTAIMGNVSSAMEQEMSQAAREVAKTTTFSAEEAAEAYFFLASAGLDAQASVAAMPQVAKFAQAGMFDLSQATDLLTDAQSALGLTVRDDAVKNLENMASVADVLVKANTLANASVEQFSQSLTNKAGAALSVANKSIEEGVAVLAVFADQGVKGAEAGERLSVMLRDIARAGAANADEFQKLGLRVFDAEGNMRNMADITAEFERVLGPMSDAQKAVTLDTLGLTRSVADNIKLVLGASDQMRDYQTALEDAGGTTDEVANKQLQTFSAQLGLVRSNIADVFLTIGSKLVPELLNMFEAFGGMDRVREITERLSSQFAFFWYQTLRPLIQGLMEELPGALTNIRDIFENVLGPALRNSADFFMNNLLPAIADFAAFLYREGMPVIESLAKFYTDVLQPAIQGVYNFIIDILVPALKQILGPVFEGIKSVLDKVTNSVDRNKEGFQKFYDSIEPIITFIRDTAAPVIGTVLKVALEVAGTALDVIITSFGLVADAISYVIDKVMEFFDALASGPGGQAISRAIDFASNRLQFRADGGPVGRNMPYIVGERGPELFIPNSDGMILPNGVGAGGNVTNINITVTSADPDAVVQAIRRYTRYNGPLGQVVTL